MPQETILVVEDESITALDIQQSLQRQGYNVLGIAASGPEAIGLARRHPPDLVLMDVRLRGEMDGIETAKRIHEQFNTPVVFLTAYADAPTLQRAKSADPFAYLLKPFEEAVLATTIEIALNKHRAHELLVRQNTEAFHLSQQRFEHLSKAIPDFAVILLDPAGLICSWNPGAEKIHGWSAAEVIGRHFSLFYPNDDVVARKPEKDLETAIRADRHQEYQSQVRKGGSRFSAQLLLIALRNTGGHLGGFLNITRKIPPGGNHN